MKMGPNEGSSGKSEDARQERLSEAEVLQLLSGASVEYEAYLSQAELAAVYRPSAELVYEPKYDWNTPMTLVTY